MKTFKAFFFIFLLSNIIVVNAQTPELFNYQTVVRDNGGNILANQNVSFRISILETTNTGTSVYTEDHSTTTTNLGLVNFQIGNGVIVSGTFNTIDWAADLHFLQIELDATGGTTYQLIGTSQLISVPYALHAKTAGNVSGLESIDEGNGIGRRLINKPAVNYDDVGLNAVDLSHSNGASTTRGASGSFSTALGRNTTASGNHATVMGYETIASGQNATAFGYFTTALGNYSTAMGRSTEATSLYSTAIGRSNVGGGNPTNWVLTDPLFEIGNGTNSSNKANALTILKNGTITAPTFDMSEITDDKALITKEYADANNTPTGLETLSEGNGIGWRLIGQNPLYYDNIGFKAVDLSYSDFSNEIDGASGYISATLGYSTTASGDNSTAMGNGTTASGFSSTSMGFATIAESYGSTAIGSFNIGGGNPTNRVLTDPLFEIGNGEEFFSRSNALTVLNNGTITAPSFDISEITDDKALITKEYADTNYLGTASTGIEALNETGFGFGHRIIGRGVIVVANYDNIGVHAVDLSYNNVTDETINGFTQYNAPGTGASGYSSVAMGNGTTASGSYSTAMGSGTNASSGSSTAMGSLTAASGSVSTAMGNATTASGAYATSMGLNTNAESFGTTAIGRYNVGGGSPNSWIDIDPLFEIGNGSTFNNRTNALTVLKNGNTGFRTATPNFNIHLKQTSDSESGLGGIGFENNGDSDVWKIYHSGAHFSFAENGVRRAYVRASTGAYVVTSDSRLKKNITDIESILSKVNSLKVHRYLYKDQEVSSKKTIGFMAQDVQQVFPELVETGENGFLGLNYAGFSVVAIKAIQEQQTVIDKQQKIIDELLKRVSALENKN